MKILIGVPTRGRDIYYNTVKFLLAQVTSVSHKVNVIFSRCNVSAEWAQRELFEFMSRSDYDYFLYLDSDVGPQKNTLVRLMSADKDIISAPVWFYDAKNYDIHLGIQMGLDTNDRLYKANGREGLQKVGFPGLACTLFKKRVFTRFKDVGEEFFSWSPLIDEKYRSHTTDNILYEKARKLGFDLWVDWDIKDTMHCRDVEMSTNTLENFLERYSS